MIVDRGAGGQDSLSVFVFEPGPGQIGRTLPAANGDILQPGGGFLLPVGGSRAKSAPFCSDLIIGRAAHPSCPDALKGERS